MNTQEYIPLQDDRTLPIKFRIETGIAGQVVVSPDSAEIPTGGTQQFTATVLDLHGNPLACSVAWASDNTAVATVDGNGLATGVAPGSANITATCQAASGSAYLSVINPNVMAVKLAEMFADLNATKQYRISRAGYYQQHTSHDADEAAEITQMLTGHSATKRDGTS